MRITSKGRACLALAIAGLATGAVSAPAMAASASFINPGTGYWVADGTLQLKVQTGPVVSDIITCSSFTTISGTVSNQPDGATVPSVRIDGLNCRNLANQISAVLITPRAALKGVLNGGVYGLRAATAMDVTVTSGSTVYQSDSGPNPASTGVWANGNPLIPSALAYASTIVASNLANLQAFSLTAKMKSVLYGGNTLVLQP